MLQENFSYRWTFSQSSERTNRRQWHETHTTKLRGLSLATTSATIPIENQPPCLIDRHRLSECIFPELKLLRHTRSCSKHSVTSSLLCVCLSSLNEKFPWPNPSTRKRHRELRRRAGNVHTSTSAIQARQGEQLAHLEEANKCRRLRWAHMLLVL